MDSLIKGGVGLAAAAGLGYLYDSMRGDPILPWHTAEWKAMQKEVSVWPTIDQLKGMTADQAQRAGTVYGANQLFESAARRFMVKDETKDLIQAYAFDKGLMGAIHTRLGRATVEVAALSLFAAAAAAVAAAALPNAGTLVKGGVGLAAAAGAAGLCYYYDSLRRNPKLPWRTAEWKAMQKQVSVWPTIDQLKGMTADQAQRAGVIFGVNKPFEFAARQFMVNDETKDLIQAYAFDKGLMGAKTIRLGRVAIEIGALGLVAAAVAAVAVAALPFAIFRSP